MLLEFEVENEGAFAVRSELSMVASKLKEASALQVRSVGDIAGTEALTSVLILGKNGSGKSTLIRALQFISQFVRDSALDTRADAKLPYDPNLLVEEFENKPTRYRVLFSVKQTIYDFEFSFNRARVLSERMEIADKSTRFRRLYNRYWDEDDGEYNYAFGEALTGTRHVWAKNTRHNALFLSTAAHLNSDILTIPYGWLSHFISSVSIGSELPEITAARCLDDPEFSKRVVLFLNAMDINVDAFDISKEKLERSFLEKTFSDSFIKYLEKIPNQVSALSDRYKISFSKKTLSGSSVSLSLNNESTGTQALFSLAGPLFAALDTGICLVVDEINTNLHPLVVHHLIDLFSNPLINTKCAQLLFTSHDVSVLREGVLRRDQVWMIDNDSYSARLVPLSDYSPRRAEALQKGYLTGRYGGIPNLMPSLIRATHAEKE